MHLALEQYETIAQFCKRVGIGRRTFERRRAVGDSPTLTRIGDRIMISASDSAAWLARHRDIPSPQKVTAA